MKPTLELPQPLFVTTREDAYREAEELAMMGFAVEVKLMAIFLSLQPKETSDAIPYHLRHHWHNHKRNR